MRGVVLVVYEGGGTVVVHEGGGVGVYEKC